MKGATVAYERGSKLVWAGGTSVVVVLLAITLALWMSGAFAIFGRSTVGAAISTSTGNVIPKGSSNSAAVYYHDFGSVSPGTIQRHVFDLVNRSNKMWTIKSLKTSCRCTVAQLSTNLIPPRDHLILPVELNVAADDGGRTLGQSVQVICENPAHNLLFRLSATVRDPITIVPDNYRLIVASGIVQEKEVIIKNYSGVDWADVTAHLQKGRHASSLLAVVATKRHVSKNAQRGSARDLPRQIWIATVRVDARDVPHGRYERLLEVATRSADGTIERNLATFIVEVRPDVRAVPQSLVLWPTTKADGSSTTTVILKYAGPHLVPDERLITYEHNLPIELDIAFSNNEASATIAKIIAHPDSSAGSTIKGMIEIDFPPPLNRSIRVPITVLGRDTD